MKRIAILDVLRGFALIGVLFANFTAYTNQQVPDEVLDSISTWVDRGIMTFNAVFIEYKFITLFSILFGYAFGLILETATNRGVSGTTIVTRRMLSLFLLGAIHAMFWWFDVLHIYAICGLLLLMFRRATPSFTIASSICLLFVVPFLYLRATAENAEPLSSVEWHEIFLAFKEGDLSTLISSNLKGYWQLFITSGNNIYYVSETLGKFLLGYLLFKVNFLDAIETKRPILIRTVVVCLPIAVLFLAAVFYATINDINLNMYYLDPLTKIGILATSILYASVIMLAFISAPSSFIFRLLGNLGRMTLTNYLLVSFAMIFVLYGVGLGLLGELRMFSIWGLGVIWLGVEVTMSSIWLRYYRFGPFEMIWRKMTWGQ